MKVVKTFFKSTYSAIRDQMRTWGMAPLRASAAEPTPAIRIRVQAPGPDGEMRRVGTLWQDGMEFCFRYDPAFLAAHDADAISAFPRLDETTYRARDLWPFFAVRVPPLRRADVRDVLHARGLREEQVLEVLGTLARKSPTNPYELQLEATGADDSGPTRRDDGRVTTAPSTPAHSAT